MSGGDRPIARGTKGEAPSAWSEKARLWVVVLVLMGNPALSIVLGNFHEFDPMVRKGYAFADSDAYVAEYFQEPNRAPYRFLVPMLARVLPDPPDWASQRGTSGVKLGSVSIAASKFATIGFVFLCGATLLMVRLACSFGLSMHESTLGGAMVLGLNQVVWLSGGPVIEPAFWFFLCLGLLAIQLRNPILLACALLAGIFVKEHILLLAFFAGVTPLEHGRRKWMFLAVLPAVVAYAAVRLLWQPVAADFLDQMFAANSLDRVGAAFRNLFSVTGIKYVFLTFGLLWLPFAYTVARVELPIILRKWGYVVPLLLVGPPLLGVHHIMRYLTAAFPVIVLVVLFGIRGRCVLAEETGVMPLRRP